MENKKTFEEKLNELETIVSKLEAGDIALDLAINKFNDAMKLAKECSDELEQANETVNKLLTKDGDFEDFNADLNN